MRTELGHVDDFPRGAVTLVEADGRQLGVVRTRDDRFIVVRNVCPHASAPVCRGILGQQLTGEPGRGFKLSPGGEPTLICPWHRWEYRLFDGTCIRDPKYRLKTWEAYVDDGRVCVDMPPRPAPAVIAAEAPA
jgi:nitrite reductase (NADH) small subunit